MNVKVIRISVAISATTLLVATPVTVPLGLSLMRTHKLVLVSLVFVSVHVHSD